MKRAWICSECGKLFKTSNERDKHKFKEIVDSGECPFCHVIGELHFTGESKTGLYCGNCERVVNYCEGIGIYEEDENQKRN